MRACVYSNMMALASESFNKCFSTDSILPPFLAGRLLLLEFPHFHLQLAHLWAQTPDHLCGLVLGSCFRIWQQWHWWQQWYHHQRSCYSVIRYGDYLSVMHQQVVEQFLQWMWLCLIGEHDSVCLWNKQKFGKIWTKVSLFTVKRQGVNIIETIRPL